MLHLEDEFGDIIGKARKGLGLSLDAVAAQAEISATEIEQMESYALKPNASVIARVAHALQLRADPLILIAKDKFNPRVPVFVHWNNCIAHMKMKYGSYEVNAYLIWDYDTKEGILFDTGADPTKCGETIEHHKIQLQAYAITHGHSDHVGKVGRLRSQYDVPVLGHEQLAEATKKVKDQEEISIGRLKIRVLYTEGHTADEASYLVSNIADNAPSVVVVGDTLFAGSVGGANYSYEELLKNVRKKLMILDDDVLVLPGHGPLTTIGQEREFNPFV